MKKIKKKKKDTKNTLLDIQCLTGFFFISISGNFLPVLIKNNNKILNLQKIGFFFNFIERITSTLVLKKDSSS